MKLDGGRVRVSILQVEKKIMIISHESNYGSEYHVRVVLNACDIEHITQRMHASPDRVDGRVLAAFLRAVATEQMAPRDKIEVGF